MYYIIMNFSKCTHRGKRINSKVGKKDTIIFLGDIGDPSYISKIRGYKILIAGNHDTGLTKLKRRTIWSAEIDGIIQELSSEFIANHTDLEIINLPNFKSYDNKLFDEVYEGVLTISDKIILSHEPLNNINYLFNLHGHDHSFWSKNDNIHLNCCAEHIDYIPISLNEIIKTGKLKYVQNIHRDTIDKAIKKKTNKK